MNQFAGEPVFVMRINFDEAAERCARDDAKVAVERAFVFLVGNERINFSTAHEHDVSGFGATGEFLEEHAFRKIHLLQPRVRLGHRLAKHGMHRTRRRAERIFNHVRRGVPREDLLGFEAVLRHMRGGEGDAVVRTQLAGKIAFALNAHGVAGRAQQSHAGVHEILSPRCLRPINGLRHDELHAEFFDERHGTRMRLAQKSRPGERRREVRVVARQVRGDGRAVIFQRLRDAVSERSDAQRQDGWLILID